MPRYPRLAAAVSWVEFFRESPGAIARRFTFGQLAVIAWQLEERASARTDESLGKGPDLRELTGSELERHLAQLGT